MGFKGKNIVFVLIFLLLIGCGTIYKYTSIASLLFVAVIILIASYKQKQYGVWFSTCLLSACACFAYINPRGGLWNLTALGVVVMAWCGKRDRLALPITFPDLLFRMLCVALTVINILGIIFRNPTGWSFRLLGLASFLGCVGLSWIVHAQQLDEEQVSIWLKTIGWCSVYIMFSAINQKYMIVPLHLPFLPLRMDDYGEAYGTTNASGCFGVGELMGEFQLLCGLIFFGMLVNQSCIEKFRLNVTWLVGIILCCGVNIVLANSRSCLLLLIVGYVVLFIYANFTMRRLNRCVVFSLIGMFFLLLIVWGNWLNWDNLVGAYANVGRYAKVTPLNILNGEAINRGLPFRMGFSRLFEERWWLGYGFGAGYSNLWAWTGSPDGYSRFFNGVVVDSHNLYLSLVPIFGWFGAVLYFVIILFTMFRLAHSFFFTSIPDHWKMFSACLYCAWIMLIIDEYKINMLRANNYLLFIWIFIGISHALSQRNRANSVVQKDHHCQPLSVSMINGKKANRKSLVCD